MNEPTYHELKLLKEIGKIIEIDTQGRVWKIARRQWNGSIHPIKRKRAEYKNKRGYLSISFHQNRKAYCIRAHRLVYTFFNGRIPDELRINHKNGIKDDNRPENLEAITIAENHRHSYRVLGRIRKGPRGEKNFNVKLNTKQVIQIRELYATQQFSARVLGKRFGISERQILEIARGTSWGHVGGPVVTTKFIRTYSSYGGKLTIDEVKRARRLYLTGNILQRELARMFNVGQATISNLLQNKSYRRIK